MRRRIRYMTAGARKQYPRNRAVVRALKLGTASPRALFRVFSWTRRPSNLLSPHGYIPAIGTPSPLHGFPVGTVIRIARAAAEEYYVVLARGVQRIGQVTADLIRFTDSQDARDIVTVAPDVIGTVPILDTLRVSAFPERGRVQRRRCVRPLAGRSDRRQYRCVDGQFASSRRSQSGHAGPS